jgi:hypothetical protein
MAPMERELFIKFGCLTFDDLHFVFRSALFPLLDELGRFSIPITFYLLDRFVPDK